MGIAIVAALQAWAAQRVPLRGMLSDRRLWAALAGAAAAVLLAGLLLGRPLRIVPYVKPLTALVKDVVTIGLAALAGLALGAATAYAFGRRRGRWATLALAVSPLAATFFFLGVQWATAPEQPYYGHPKGVPVPDNAIIERVATGLNFPDALVSDSQGRILYAEAFTGRIVALERQADGSFVSRMVAQAPLPENMQADQVMWDIALDPKETYLYAMAIEKVLPLVSSYPCCDTSRIVRFPYRDGQAGQMEVVVSGLPAARHHSGGALAFGPDGMLYASVGDVEHSYTAMAPGAIPGAILRLTPEGGIPKDNPFPLSPAYAHGFRSPFGMAFHPLNGSLYLTDNGNSCCDRLIRVERGKYHDRLVFTRQAGAEEKGEIGADPSLAQRDPNVVAPLTDSGLARTAPTKLLAYGGDRYGPAVKGNLFYGTFHDGALHRVVLSEDGRHVVLDEIVVSALSPGRAQELGSPSILGIAATPDGTIYFSTLTGVFRITGFKGVGG